jgi:hypothetical protein
MILFDGWVANQKWTEYDHWVNGNGDTALSFIVLKNGKKGKLYELKAFGSRSGMGAGWGTL